MALGIAAFLDSIYNYGEIFRRANSIMFMLVALGLIARTSIKIRRRRIEGYIARIEELKMQIKNVQRSSLQASSPHRKIRQSSDALATSSVSSMRHDSVFGGDQLCRAISESNSRLSNPAHHPH
jgi:hypothetical protein